MSDFSGLNSDNRSDFIILTSSLLAGSFFHVFSLSDLPITLIFNTALLCYDHLLTFDREVRYIWPRGLCGSSILYFAIRYPSLVYISLLMYFVGPWQGKSLQVRLIQIDNGNCLIAVVVSRRKAPVYAVLACWLTSASSCKVIGKAGIAGFIIVLTAAASECNRLFNATPSSTLYRYRSLLRTSRVRAMRATTPSLNRHRTPCPRQPYHTSSMSQRFVSSRSPASLT